MLSVFETTDPSFFNPSTTFEDSIANICWFPQEPSPNIAISSWDCKITIYEAPLPHNASITRELRSFSTEYPCLALCYMTTPDYLVVGSLDGTISAYEVETGRAFMTLGKHDDAVQGIYRGDLGYIYYSVSYDSTLKIWDARQQNPAAMSFDLGSKAVCSDVAFPYMVVGLSNQKFRMFDLNDVTTAQRIGLQLETTLGVDSPLTDVSISKFGAIGLGSSSGRSAISWIVPNGPNGSIGMKNTYCFKGHKSDPGQNGNVTGKTIMYPMNAVGMHPKDKDTYFTAGRDGCVHFWNITKRSRMTGFTWQGVPVTKARYSPDGKYLAYGIGYDWSNGIEGAKSHKTKFCVHTVQPNELPKP